MTKDEMRELLRTCKAIYSRFEGAEKVDGQIRILNEVVDAWHNAIGWMTFDEAHMILTRHTVSENGDKAPTLKTFVTGGKVQKDAGRITMTLDRRNGLVIWEPEEHGKKIEAKTSWNKERGVWETRIGGEVYDCVLIGEVEE